MAGTGCVVTLVAGWAMAVVLVTATALVRAAIGAWPVMLALGVLHKTFPQVPAFGLFETLLLLFAFGLVATALVAAPVTTVNRKQDAT